MRILSFVIFLIATIPVSAQQWVLDEIAEEHDSSESIPTWSFAGQNGDKRLQKSVL